MGSSSEKEDLIKSMSLAQYDLGWAYTLFAAWKEKKLYLWREHGFEYAETASRFGKSSD